LSDWPIRTNRPVQPPISIRTGGAGSQPIYARLTTSLMDNPLVPSVPFVFQATDAGSSAKPTHYKAKLISGTLDK